MRITLILKSGKVDCDSQNRPEELENQLNRPEIHQAFLDAAQDAIRYNSALDERVIYMAVPLLRNDTVFGVLYLSKSLADLDQARSRIAVLILLVGLAIGAGTIPLAWWVAREFARPRESGLRSGPATSRTLILGRWWTC